MSPFLMKIVQFFARRPKDGTIRWLHIFTGLAILAILYLARDRYVVDVPFVGVYPADIEVSIEYGLMVVLGLFFFLRGIISACVIKSKLLRWKQGILGFLMIIVGGPVMDPVTITQTAAANTTGGFQIDTPAIVSSLWHPGVFLVLLGIIWIFIGLTGKGVMSKCIHYGETVKKIRV